MPPQTQANNLFLQAMPNVLKKLNVIERQLIAIRIPFMKLLSLPRGGQNGMKGPVVNIPSDLNGITTSLARPTGEAQLMKVKLKRKLSYKGHYKYEWVNPNNEWDSNNITFNSNWCELSDDPALIKEQSLNIDTCYNDEEENWKK